MPGVTWMAYGLAASALVVSTRRADAPCRRNCGPTASSSSAPAHTAARTTDARRISRRPTVWSAFSVRHLSIACSTRRSTMAGWTSWSPMRPVAPTSTALRMAACRDGSCSSTKSATCMSETRRRMGLTNHRSTSPANTARIAIRKPQMAPGLNLSVCSPNDASSSASSAPATMTMPPRSSMRVRQRPRTSRMTSSNSSWRGPPPCVSAMGWFPRIEFTPTVRAGLPRQL